MRNVTNRDRMWATSVEDSASSCSLRGDPSGLSFPLPTVRSRSVRKLIPCSGRAVVIPQQPTQPLAATNVGAPERAGPWRDQVVAEPLMVPLPVVVRHELVEHAQQAPFPEENQAVQTLLANRAHEPLRVGVGVRCLEGR